MISTNYQLGGLAHTRTGLPAGRPGPVPESSPEYTDGVQLGGGSGPDASPISRAESEASASGAQISSAQLGKTSLEVAMQSLPPGGSSARFLTSEPAPWTSAQRSACIADLETLNLAGELRSFNPLEMEYTRCSVAEALKSMSEHQPIFYQEGRTGKESPQKIAGLQSLAELARQAELGRIG